PEAFEAMRRATNTRTVPQIFIGDTHVGGFTDLRALHNAGRLTELLQKK
ncbi:MAG: glutaredoxin domain-containing protein, partial [Neisseria elongata]